MFVESRLLGFKENSRGPLESPSHIRKIEVFEDLIGRTSKVI